MRRGEHLLVEPEDERELEHAARHLEILELDWIWQQVDPAWGGSAQRTVEGEHPDEGGTQSSSEVVIRGNQRSVKLSRAPDEGGTKSS